MFQVSETKTPIQMNRKRFSVNSAFFLQTKVTSFWFDYGLCLYNRRHSSLDGKQEYLFLWYASKLNLSFTITFQIMCCFLVCHHT